MKKNLYRGNEEQRKGMVACCKLRNICSRGIAQVQLIHFLFSFFFTVTPCSLVIFACLFCLFCLFWRLNVLSLSFISVSWSLFHLYELHDDYAIVHVLKLLKISLQFLTLIDFHEREPNLTTLLPLVHALFLFTASFVFGIFGSVEYHVWVGHLDWNAYKWA